MWRCDAVLGRHPARQVRKAAPGRPLKPAPTQEVGAGAGGAQLRVLNPVVGPPRTIPVSKPAWSVGVRISRCLHIRHWQDGAASRSAEPPAHRAEGGCRMLVCDRPDSTVVLYGGTVVGSIGIKPHRSSRAMPELQLDERPLDRLPSPAAGTDRTDRRVPYLWPVGRADPR